MLDGEREAEIRSFAAERSYRAALVDRWLRLAPDDAAALLELARELRLGENQLRDLWEWAEDIARREAMTMAAVMKADLIAAARRRAGSRNDRLKTLKAVLRRWRFPRLAEVEDRLDALLRDLRLSPHVRVLFPDFLEGDQLRVEIVADSLSTLRAAAAQLAQAAETRTCEEIFELLNEAP